MKPGTFIMNGVNSESLHTYIQDRPLIDTPQRKVEWKSGYGVDGDVPFDEKAYNNTELELIMVTNGLSLIGDRQKLFNVMDTKGSYGELVPYFDPTKIYRVMLNDKMSFENKYYYGNAQASSAKFTVKPYKYLIDSPSKIITTSSTKMTNPTNYVSQPILKLEGTGDVIVRINGLPFEIKNLPDKITIDSERYIAYTEGATGPIESMNSRILSREYPLLVPGENAFVITGNVTKMEIIPRWRSLV